MSTIDEDEFFRLNRGLFNRINDIKRCLLSQKYNELIKFLPLDMQGGYNITYTDNIPHLSCVLNIIGYSIGPIKCTDKTLKNTELSKLESFASELIGEEMKKISEKQRILQEKEQLSLMLEIKKIQNELVELILNENDQAFSHLKNPIAGTLNELLMSRISHLYHDQVFVKKEFDKLINFKKDLIRQKIYSILPSTFFNSSKNVPDIEELKNLFATHFGFILTLTNAVDILKFSWQYYLEELFNQVKYSILLRIEMNDYFNRFYGGILTKIEKNSSSLNIEKERFYEFNFILKWTRFIKKIETLDKELEVRKRLKTLVTMEKEYAKPIKINGDNIPNPDHKIFISLGVKIHNEFINKKNEKLYELYDELLLVGVLSE